MIEVKNIVKKSKKDIDAALTREFVLASKNDNFTKLCAKLKCDEKILKKYTSKLEECTKQLEICAKCKGLNECKLDVVGHIFYPNLYNDYLEFSYKPCKYYKNAEKKELKTKTKFFETSSSLRNATLSEIIGEKERSEILKYIKEFLKKKVNGEKTKGLYLSGSFGSGKSYILSALLNELSLKGYNCINIHYPSLLRKLKVSFNENNYDALFEEILDADILLLDDIGAENNSAWARDEVLSTIVQHRMDNNLTTFFTSNFNLNELEMHLSETTKSNDKIKARRIIERIKSLTLPLELISKDKRN